MSDLAIELVHIDKLTPYARNARTHSTDQIAQLAESIKAFGWTSPILINADGGIIAGHGRALAAELIGMTEVPTIRLTHLTEAQERALVLADNKLALNAGWDESALAAELAALSALDFDMTLTGFDEDELSRLIDNGGGDSRDPDETPDAPEEPTSRIGDVWLMGKHRLMCGSSTDAADLATALGGLKPGIACSDPPYGIRAVKGGRIGNGKAFGDSKPKKGRVHGPAKNAIIEPGTYAPIIGDDTTETAVAHYRALLELQIPVIVLWGGNYFANDLPPSRCWLVWDKENTGTFADAELAWTNQDKVVKLIRHQWSGLIKASERGERRVHPTQKPVALAEWVCETLDPTGQVILDGFLGSAWTLIAAERMGRICVGIELSPAYVDVAVMRWEAFSSGIATLEATGQTFAEVRLERAA